MKRLLLFSGLFAGMCCSVTAFSQTSNAIVIKAGEDVSLIYRQIFRYPDFQFAKVYLNDGDSAGNRLNWNLYMGAIQFINATGDTLVMEDPSIVKKIVVGKDTIYRGGDDFYELVANFKKARLVVTRKLILADEQKIGAYGLPTSTHSIETKKSLKAEQNYQLKLQEDLVFTKEMRYFFVENGNQFQPVTKKNLLKGFPKHKDAIENYLKQNNINWKNEEDLRKLFSFLDQL